MATWFSCNPCSQSDPTSDTVKVDPSLLINKENVQPKQPAKEKEEQERQRQRQAEEEAATRRKEQAAAEAAAEAARVRAEAEKAATERVQRQEVARREAEEAARSHDWARQEEEAARAAVAQAAAAAAAAEEKAEEQRRQATIAHNEAVEKANEWCSKNGFPDLNTQKKTFRGATKTPLHTAVKYNNQEIVGVLLAAGVDKHAKDSKNQTPSELAAKLNKNGSHEQILTMLR